MKSDLGFNLLHSRNAARHLITATIYALELSPGGLLANIEHLVANPPHDHDHTKREELGNGVYLAMR